MSTKRSEMKAALKKAQKENATLAAALKARINIFKIETRWLGAHYVTTQVLEGGEVALVESLSVPEKQL